MSPDHIVPLLVIAAPLMLLAAGLVPTGWANAHPKTMTWISEAAAWLSFASAAAAAVVFVAIGGTSWTLASTPLPGQIGALSLDIYVNSVTAIMLTLVSFVAAIVTRFSRNYMAGDPNQGRFNKWLALTLAAILTLVSSGNLLIFALAWIATSLALHQLLMFYDHRPIAVLVAHKKFIASRISDLSLLGAILLIGSTLHTLQFQEMTQMLSVHQGPLPMSLEIASLMIVFSAGLKSAQFPFHGWLLQVMEAPTPVSALLHAGIVNAGAFLVIRMSPVVSHAEYALAILAIVGLVTLAVATLVMLTQTSIKVSLAWSTTGQMGFMLLECGLGLYSLAMLHLVAHSLYKAHAFLASGSGVDAFRGAIVANGKATPSFGATILAVAAGAAIVGGVSAATGMNTGGQPALFAAAAVVAIAIGQLLIQMASVLSGPALVLRGLGSGLTVAAAYFALHRLFEHAVAGSYVPLQAPASPVQYGLSTAVAAVFLGLLLTQQALRANPAAFGDAVYMHLYNGLYIDVFITRLSQMIWPSPTPEPEVEPTPFSPVPPQGGLT